MVAVKSVSYLATPLFVHYCPSPLGSHNACLFPYYVHQRRPKGRCRGPDRKLDWARHQTTWFKLLMMACPVIIKQLLGRNHFRLVRTTKSLLYNCFQFSGCLLVQTLYDNKCDWVAVKWLFFVIPWIATQQTISSLVISISIIIEWQHVRSNTNQLQTIVTSGVSCTEFNWPTEPAGSVDKDFLGLQIKFVVLIGSWHIKNLSQPRMHLMKVNRILGQYLTLLLTFHAFGVMSTTSSRQYVACEYIEFAKYMSASSVQASTSVGDISKSSTSAAMASLDLPKVLSKTMRLFAMGCHMLGMS